MKKLGENKLEKSILFITKRMNLGIARFGYAFLATMILTSPVIGQNELLDLSFNQTGFVLTPEGLANDEQFRSCVVEDDGKIIAAGGTMTPLDDFPAKGFWVQLNADGTLDSSFGTNGLHFIDVTSNDEVCYYVEFQNDGKIILAGVAANAEGYKGSLVQILPSSLVNIEKRDEQSSLTFYPNPSNELAFVNISLKREGRQSLFLVDLKGQLVETIFSEKDMDRGEQTVSFSTSSMISSGMYKPIPFIIK